MALIPKISASLSGKCNLVTFTEETQPYNATHNPGGWGTPNIDTDMITSAFVEVYIGTNPPNTSSSPLATYYLKDATTDVYANVPGSPTPYVFDALIEQPWTLADGIYQLVYTVMRDPLIYKNKTYNELFLCNLCNCKDSLIARLVKACDPLEVEKLKTQVDQMEVFIYGIQSAFACQDFTTANSLLSAATKYCSLVSDCGCGCGGGC